MLLREEPSSGSRLAAPWRQMIAAALREAANSSGVALCYTDGSGTNDPAFVEVCTRPAPALPTLRFNGDVRIARQKLVYSVVVTLTLEVGGGHPGVDAHSKLLAYSRHFVLPPSVEPEQRDKELARQVQRGLSKLSDIREWFASLHEDPRLVRRRPTQASLAASREQPATLDKDDALPTEPQRSDEVGEARRIPRVERKPAPGAAHRREAWREEQLDISELLLSGEAEEARKRALRLLEQDLDEDIAAQTRRLLERAEQMLAEGSPSTAVPPNGLPGEAPAGAPQAGEAPPGDEQLEEAEPFDFTFQVRAAAPGSGFINGSSGRLRVWDGGVRFTPTDDNPTVQAWQASWRQIARVGRAEGLWDVRHPLVIEERSGERQLLTVIAADGRYSDGQHLLDLIARGLQRTGSL